LLGVLRGEEETEQQAARQTHISTGGSFSPALLSGHSWIGGQYVRVLTAQWVGWLVDCSLLS
jgi:hypothetical protein